MMAKKKKKVVVPTLWTKLVVYIVKGVGARVPQPERPLTQSYG